MIAEKDGKDMEKVPKSSKIVPRSERRGSVLRREALGRLRQGKGGSPRGENDGGQHDEEEKGRITLRVDIASCSERGLLQPNQTHTKICVRGCCCLWCCCYGVVLIRRVVTSGAQLVGTRRAQVVKSSLYLLVTVICFAVHR